jgi:hypothetical protein
VAEGSEGWQCSALLLGELENCGWGVRAVVVRIAPIVECDLRYGDTDKRVGERLVL